MSGYSRYGNLNVYKGIIGEELARRYLEKQGFKVMSYMILVDLVMRHPLISISEISRSAHDFLGLMKKNFIGLNKALDKIYSGKEHKRRRFDFLAKKEDKYYVVEVKTNKAQLNKWEREGLQLSKKFDFIPMLVRTKVTLIADYKDVIVKTL